VNKGLLLGIIGGVTVFILSISIIIYMNSDLDQRLIEEVGSGVPTTVMYNQIDNDTKNQKSIAKGDLDSHVMDPTDWEKNGVVTDNDYEYYIQIYSSEIGFISKYNQVRKEYVAGKISKEEFLEESKIIKDDLDNFSM
jgi:hypothetical protein